MQTFITDHNMATNARNLDNKRLGKQRVEALQIFECLMIEKTRWENHPSVKMWKGYELFLLHYYISDILDEWELMRNFKNEKCRKKFNKYIFNPKYHDFIKRPPWITDEFIEAHRSNLIRKNPEYYRPLFPNTKEGLEYIWPV